MDIKLSSITNSISLDDERILTNDVTFPHEYNPHNVRFWVIGNVYGAACAVWADCEQGAIDEACDAGLMDAFLVDEDDFYLDMVEADEYSHIGNAGELADLQDLWMEAVDLKAQDIQLIIKLAEARGAVVETLDEI